MVHLKDYRIGQLPESRLRAPGDRGLRRLHGRVQERGPVRRSGRGQPGLPRHHPGRPGRRRPVPARGAGRALRPHRLGRPADLLRQPRGHGPPRTSSKTSPTQHPRTRRITYEQESTPRHHRPGPAGRRLRQVHRGRAGPQHGDRRHLRHRPREEGAGRVPVPGRPLLRRLHRDARKRRRRRGRHVRAALPAPGNGHRDPQAQHPRPRGEAGRRVHQAGQGAQRVRRQSKPELSFAIMFNQRNNPLYQRAEGDRGQRARSAASAAPTGSSPTGGGRRATTTPASGAPRGAARAAACWSTRHRTSWTCGSGSAACRSPCTRRWPTASAGTSPSRTRSPPWWTTATAPRASSSPPRTTSTGTDRFEILGDQGKIVVENSKTATVTRLRKPERELSDGMGMDDVRKLFMGELNPEEYYTTEVIEFESVWGAPARRRPGELRRQHPGRHPAAGPGIGRHQRRPAGQRHPPLQLDRHGSGRWTSTRTCSSPS